MAYTILNMEDHRLYLRPPIWLPILIAFIVSGSYLLGKKIETRSFEPPTISVTGDGRVFAVPDIASLNFGVQTGRQKTAEDAMKILTKKIEAVFDALRSVGVEERDIKSQYLSLNPAYDWNEGRQIDRGFEANQSLMVKIRDLNTISSVLDAAVRTGANQIGNVNFTIDDPDSLQEQARAEAIQEAKEKAFILARQLGKSLGDLKGFTEGGNEYPPMMMARGIGKAEMDLDSALPVPGGEEEIRIQVNLTYEIY